MKGITPVIAIILLLMITIAMVGFAFVWFTQVAQTASNATQTQMDVQQRQFGTSVRIDNIDKTSGSVIVRNTGTYELSATETKVFVNGTIEVTGCPSGSVAPGAVFNCTDAKITGCGSIRISTIGRSDSANC
ncbi:MAG TPA: archaellin/type IV pilin N-terminal domain-containing protein [archaeon]|nr:archaellin/type IV pilin N-terminal domain-containing protein [archaeon]